MTGRLTQYKPILLASVWLAIAASRILLLSDWVNLSVDEIWAAWRSYGTPAEIVRWTPLDWPPGSYLMIGAWEYFVGIHPVALRMLPLLLFLLGLAVLYRLVTRLHGETAALLTVLVLAASGEGIFRSVFLRGHSFILSLLPLLLLMMVSYFERPRWWLGVLLGAMLAFYLYLHTIVVLLFLLLGSYTIIMYPRRIWCWTLPVVVLLALGMPEILDKYQLALGRATVVPARFTGGFGEAMALAYGSFSGRLHLVWLVVGLSAVGAWLWRGRQHGRLLLAFGLWALVPVVYLILEPVLKLFQPRYMVWAYFGLSVGIGIGLAYLPRVGQWMAGAALVGMMLFAPVRQFDYDTFPPRMGDTFVWLAERAQWGDVLVIDPQLLSTACADCQDAEFFHYYRQVYFPQNLVITDDPGEAERVWYVRFAGEEDAQTLAQVQSNRVAGEFFGPTEFFTRLYTAPPDPEGVPFDNGMRLHGVQVLEDGTLDLQHHHVRKSGEDVTVRIWWSADEPIDLDYSVGLFLTDDGEVVDEAHGSPEFVYPLDNTPSVTSGWEPGALYVEERTVTIPAEGHMTTNILALQLTVYQWWDNQRILTESADANGLVELATIMVRLF